MFRRRCPVAYSQRGESWSWNTFGTWVGAMERIDERERNMPINSAQVNWMVQLISIPSYRGTEIAFEHIFFPNFWATVHFRGISNNFKGFLMKSFARKKHVHPSVSVRPTKCSGSTSFFGHRSNIFCPNTTFC